jgi:hypothetical protein
MPVFSSSNTSTGPFPAPSTDTSPAPPAHAADIQPAIPNPQSTIHNPQSTVASTAYLTTSSNAYQLDNPVWAPLPAGAEYAREAHLRALSLGVLFDKSINLYKRNFRPFLAAAAIVIVPVFLLNTTTMLLIHYLDSSFMAVQGLLKMSRGLLMMISGLMTMVFNVAVIRMASNANLGLPVSAREAYQFALKKFGSILLTSILVTLVIIFGCVLLILPGIFFSIIYFLTFNVLTLENRGGIAAMRRSAFLVRSFWMRTFMFLFLCFGMFYLFAMLPVVGMVLLRDVVDKFALELMQTTFSQGVSLFISPLMGIFGTIYYYDLRVIKEGLDIDLTCETLWPQSSAPSSS